MTTTTLPVRAGVLVWNQYTSWAAMTDVDARIDALGYDSLRTYGHFQPNRVARPAAARLPA